MTAATAYQAGGGGCGEDSSARKSLCGGMAAFGQGLQHGGGGISEPLDLTVQKIVKSKNESRFTTSLLSGDHSGYAVGQGI